MGKSSLKKNPVLKIFFESIDIAFNKESKTDSYKAFKKAGKNLDLGQSAVIFPEGSITADPPHLRPFKSGAFKLAIEKDVAIVPVSILNSFDIFYGEGRWGARPGIIHCYVHKPITQNFYSANAERELKERVYSTIANKIQEFWMHSHYEEGWSPEHPQI